ncbi:MAG: sodium:calcium antiporter [Candidatus Staskawiczbacteria bacterium]|nr:sodium:calcium antiporter [Candidatus Staskawiczbacteria bacterium]
MFFYITTFLFSAFILTLLSSGLINSLVNLAKYLKWREFIIAFFVMAMASSMPNLFVDIGAALRGFPELAFGDILGGNLADLTLVMALAIFMSKRFVLAESKMVQESAIFMAVISVMPLLLILDGKLGRIDGLALILTFFIYAFWIFSRADRFKKIYKDVKQKPVKEFSNFLKDLAKIIIFLMIILAASQVIINSAQYFSDKLGISLSLVGLLIFGLGNCFPETYFSIISARRGEGYMILGDLMGSVISCSTLVLGIVAVIFPFQINDFSPFLIARIFFIVALVVFLITIKTGRKITKKEAIVLLFIYIAFLLVEIFGAGIIQYF